MIGDWTPYRSKTTNKVVLHHSDSIAPRIERALEAIIQGERRTETAAALRKAIMAMAEVDRGLAGDRLEAEILRHLLAHDLRREG